MIVAPYDRNRNYDILYEKLILSIRKTIDEKDDDFLGLYIGQTGTGKSNLMLHGYELFDPDGCSVDLIGIDKRTHANALKSAKEKPNKRFCADDEANVSSRDAMTKYNKDKIDLYYAIRGVRIFHAWCNPSAQTLDKVFIKERIKGLFFVATKDVDRPRVYYYFRKVDILKMLEKEGDLEIQTFKKSAKNYAYYKGWFRAYKGKLLKDYLDKKSARMSDKIDMFADRWGGDIDESLNFTIKNTDMRRLLYISHETLRRYTDKMLASGELILGEDFVEGASGKKLWSEKAVEKFKNHAKSIHYARTNNIKVYNSSSRVREEFPSETEGSFEAE